MKASAPACAIALLLISACSPETGKPPAPVARQEADVVQGPTCEPLPEPVLALIAARTGWRVLKFEDLHPDDKGFWMETRREECPGHAKAVLTKGAAPSHAVVLATGAGDKLREQLVVFIPTGDGQYQQKALSDPAHYPIPAVVWVSPPGVHHDQETGESVRSENDSIAMEQMEAWVVQFIYDGQTFTIVQTVI